MTAVSVYLDTQDFIRTFNAPSNDTLNELLSLRDAGRCEIGYSALHLIEFITKTPEGYSAERIDRGRHIKRICGKNAFPWISDLAKGRRFPNDGYWINLGDEVSVDLGRLKNSFRKELHDRANLDRSLSRAERRVLKSNRSLPELMRRFGRGFRATRETFKGFPVTDEFIQSDVFGKLLRGECSQREADRLFKGWLNDPELFSQIIFDYSGAPPIVQAHFSETLSKLGGAAEAAATMSESLSRYDEKVSEARSLAKQVGIAFPKVATSEKILRDATFDASELEAWVGPGRADHFVHYFKHLVRNPASYAESDLFDLYHLTYGYDCDLFRCDRKMYEIFKTFPPFSGKLVRLFDDLPSAIMGV